MRAHESVIPISTFGPSSAGLPGTTMPSADFCMLARHVAMQGAKGLFMSRCLFCVSLGRDSHPSTADGYAGYLLMNLLSRDMQISPDKACPGPRSGNVNFPCTNAAFTLPHEPWSPPAPPLAGKPAGFVVIGRLAQGLSLICGFCPSSRTFAKGLPSDLSSRRRTCLRLELLLETITMNTIGSRTGDFHPISSRPCRAYTTPSTRRGMMQV